jgi:TRAP-type C4-dicarboxylate transport system permease small subunit
MTVEAIQDQGAVQLVEPPGPPLTGPLTAVNARSSRWAMYLACLGLISLVAVVDYGVLLRYAFNSAPPFVEQVALLLVITVAMFGACAGVRDEGHIGVESLVILLPARAQHWIGIVVGLFTILFAGLLLYGCAFMAVSVHNSTIPTLGVSEALRYVPPIIAAILIILFSIEHLIASITGKHVVASWH